MTRFRLASSAILLALCSFGSLARAEIISFLNFDREAVKSIGGQTFPWSSGGLSGTVTVRPSGTIAALTETTPSVGNGRAPRSSFYIGLQSEGGPVGVSFEFLFNRPIDITIYNTETLAGRERITLQTDGDPWTGGWYSSTTGNIVGLGTRTVELTPTPPTPPHPFAAMSSKGVTRLEFLNEILLLPGVPGRVGNGIDIQIDSSAVPEPTWMHLATPMAAVLVCYRAPRRGQVCRAAK